MSAVTAVSVTPAMPALLAKPGMALRVHWIDRLPHVALLGLLGLLAIGLIAPLFFVLSKALQRPDGAAFGVSALGAYASSPALLQSLWNSTWVSLLVTLIVVPLAFAFAYALTRSRMPLKPLFRTITLLPLLAPSLLSAISLIYWFGNQGIAKDAWRALGFDGIYGASGIVLAECFSVFPHVLMILVTALTLADARLYEAADALGTSSLRKFFTITLPGAKYGLISAGLVSFTLVMTDFGIPKVVGGNFNVLATDVFKLVIGQHDFQRGAVVALFLLTPAALTFVIDYFVQRKQVAVLSARAVALVPRLARRFDAAMTIYCTVIAGLMLAMFCMAVFASVTTLWPYNLTPTWAHYVSGLVDAELGKAMLNSLTLAGCTAVLGTIVVFLGAYLLEKTRGLDWARPVIRLIAMLPMAVPGLVLGLGYIFFFNAPANPLNFMYQSMGILVLCTVIHFYTTGHLTMVTALKSIDAEFEAVAASLKVPFYKTFWRVTLPICLPTLLDVSRYFFINAMTTISAVVFLYSSDTKVAAVAILNLDEAGDTGPAAAMAVLIAATSLIVTLLYLLVGKWVDRRTQVWRAPSR